MEKQIAFCSRGRTVRGAAHVPAGAHGAPVIVMCHGFTGNMSEHGLFEAFAEQACGAGFYALRFDCVGSGGSDGDFAADTYLGGWRDDMLAALAFAADQPETDAARMAVMGISMGAAAALLTLPDSRVRAAVGWAPVLYPAETFLKIMGEEKWQKLKNGETIHHEYADSSFDAAPRFVQDAETLSVERAVCESGKPVLLRLGTADTVVDSAFGPRIASHGLPFVTVQTVPGEDHGFAHCKQENYDETIAFFRRRLMEKGAER